MINAVCIPIYKEHISHEEIVSLKRCFEILRHYKIIFVAPQDLDISSYKELLNIKLFVEYFEKKYFVNIAGYNQLMLSNEFYQRFIQYNYILIYQLDCYVFRDELQYWCEKAYDYIGAPWLDYGFYNMSKFNKFSFLMRMFFGTFKKINSLTSKNMLINNVGNGGFSLRKVQKFIEVLNNIDQSKIDIFRKSNDSSSILNEDIFWSFVATGVKKPSYKIASQFSLDTAIEIGIKLNHGNLPFGCHGWIKGYRFWEKHIKL